jgi:tetratricopeptide (TPR) repeat protein
MGAAMLADRYSYLSMMVWVPLMACGFTRLSGCRWFDRRLGFAGLAVLSVLTWSQCRTWRDPETLWRYALTHGSSGAADVRTALGTVLAEQGRLAEAEVQFAEAVRIEPRSAAARNNLGLVRLDQGEPDRAIPELMEAIRLRPDYAFTYNNLGLAFARTGKPDQAVHCFEQSIRVRFNNAEAHNNLGFTLLELGRKAEALAHFQTALQIRPDYAPARRNLLTALSPKRVDQ